MKKTKLLESISLLVIIAMIVLAYYFSQALPERVISHWNAQGQADDYSTKNFFVFFVPLMTIGIYLLMKYLPKIDPKKVNYVKFDVAYNFLRLYIILFMLVIYYISGMMNLDFGRDWQLNKIMPVLMAVLFISIGLIMPKIKQNWFAGIRTPWTLSSSDIWDKTHKLAGKMFILAGIVFLSMMFLPGDYFWVVMAGVIIAAFVPVIYSYFLYKNSQKLPPEGPRE
mgnify:CR=1 FL=1